MRFCKRLDLLEDGRFKRTVFAGAKFDGARPQLVREHFKESRKLAVSEEQGSRERFRSAASVAHQEEYAVPTSGQPTRCPAPTEHIVQQPWAISFCTKTNPPPVPALNTTGQRSQSKSLLFDLPLDLRGGILSCVLTTDDELFLDIVALEAQPPNHWHPKLRGKECYRSRCLCWLDVPSHVLFCAHGYPLGDPGLSVAVLRVCRQLHSEGARILYSRNTFAIDLCVPHTPRYAERYEISTVRFENILPIHPTYHSLLRAVGYRLLVHEGSNKAYATPFFSSAMMFVLQDMPGAYMAFRQRYNPDRRDPECEVVHSEILAGWSAVAHAPAWCSGRHSPLALMARPFLVSDSRMFLGQTHWNMSTPWETPSPIESNASKGQADAKQGLDLRIWNDPAMHTGPWTPESRTCRQAARI